MKSMKLILAGLLTLIIMTGCQDSNDAIKAMSDSEVAGQMMLSLEPVWHCIPQQVRNDQPGQVATLYKHYDYGSDEYKYLLSINVVQVKFNPKQGTTGGSWAFKYRGAVKVSTSDNLTDLRLEKESPFFNLTKSGDYTDPIKVINKTNEVVASFDHVNKLVYINFDDGTQSTITYNNLK